MAKSSTKEVGEKKVRTREQVSAGGVTFRRIDGLIEIAIVLIVPEMRWQLPKGLVDEGETIEEAAVREVREEAGIETDLTAPLEETEYWFYANKDGERTRFHKTVHWFLMRYRGGTTENHDAEVAEARWAGIEEALDMLVFKNEREVVKKAVTMIKESEPPAAAGG